MDAAGNFMGLELRKNMAGYQGHGPGMIVGGLMSDDQIRKLRSVGGKKAARDLKPFISHIYKKGIERATEDDLKKYNKLVGKK